jgi:hypothetical protein
MLQQETTRPGQKYQMLTPEQAKLLAQIILSNNEHAEIAETDYPFLSQIVKKRVEALKLPIKLSPAALIAVNAFTDRPGSAVVLLIDALNKYTTEEDYKNWLQKKPSPEPREITVSDLCMLYPEGFYTEAALTDLIDNTMKAHHPDSAEDMKAVRDGTFKKEPKIRWAELY